MRLLKVRDNRGRPISNLDLLMRVVFGDKTPTEFVPGDRYNYGDITYNIGTDGILRVWECNNDGKYTAPKEPYFSEFTLDSLFNNIDFSSILNRLDALENLNLYEFKQELYDGHASTLPKEYLFTSGNTTFDFENYTDVGDSLEVYLRGKYADHYILPSEYRITDNTLDIRVPYGVLDDVIEHHSIFLPEGKIIDKKEYDNYEYWYGEAGVRKTFDPDGLDLIINPFQLCHVDIEQDYELKSFKIEAVHTLVISPYEVPHMDDLPINHHDEISDAAITKDEITVKIPVTVEESAEKYDTLYVTYNQTDSTIHMTTENGYIKQIKFTCTVSRMVPDEILVVGTKCVGDKSRYIKIVEGFGEICEIDGKNYVKIPYTDLLQYNCFVYEVYRNRTFTEDYEELIGDDGGTYLEISDDYVNWDVDTFYFRIYYSISQGVGLISCNDKNVVSNPKEAFRLPLSLPFVNKYQWLRMRTSRRLLDTSLYGGAKEIAYINDMNWYVDIGRTLRASVFSVILENIVRREKSETTIGQSELYPTFNDTSVLPIPFIDYNVSNDDFLVFHSTGALISSAKWHLNKHSVDFYVHEEPLYNSDYVEFKMVDRDPTFRVASTYLTTIEDYQESYDLGFDADASDIACMLLFTVNGEYISDYRYHIENSKLTFIDENNSPVALFEEGDRFDMVVGRYVAPTTRTIVMRTRIMAVRNNQSMFLLDSGLQFNGKTDSMFIFQANGMYVGEKFYSIDNEIDAIILEGSPVPIDQYLDVIIFRKSNYSISLVEPEPEAPPLPDVPVPPDVKPVEPNNTPRLPAIATGHRWTVLIKGTFWHKNLEGEGYTKEINIYGIKADDNLRIGLIPKAETAFDAKQEKDAFNTISRIEAEDNKITIYCFKGIPKREITIGIVADRVDVIDMIPEESKKKKLDYDAPTLSANETNLLVDTINNKEDD